MVTERSNKDLPTLDYGSIKLEPRGASMPARVFSGCLGVFFLVLTVVFVLAALARLLENPRWAWGICAALAAGASVLCGLFASRRIGSRIEPQSLYGDFYYGGKPETERRRRVFCDEHGDRYATFVCRHLVRGTGLGFFTPDPSPTADEADERCAWCAECEKVRKEQGGWNDISEEFAGVTMICDACYEEARLANEGRASPRDPV